MSDMRSKSFVQEAHAKYQEQQARIWEQAKSEIRDPDILRLFEIKEKYLKSDEYGIVLKMVDGGWDLQQAWVETRWGGMQFADVENWCRAKPGELEKAVKKAIAEVEIFKARSREQQDLSFWWKKLWG